MKLTAEQIYIITHCTDENYIDREKLVSYLEKHKTIKNEVFQYCSKVTKGLGPQGYCGYLEKEPMFSPVSRETFMRRLPFYFYLKPFLGKPRSGLSLFIPKANGTAGDADDYESFYVDLEWMLYDLGIPIDVIFNYVQDQLSAAPEPKKSLSEALISINAPRNLFWTGQLDRRDLFGYWRHYLRICAEIEWTDYLPTSLITAYNNALEQTGQQPVIYYPIKDCGFDFFRDDSEIVCNGHFPCNANGRPIMKWTSVYVVDPIKISYTGEKSRCGELRITLGPKTLVYYLEKQSEDTDDCGWKQLYAGPQTMEFDNEALRELRKSKRMTQGNVADAIGTSVRTYQKWESGETTPDGHSLLRLMNWLDVDDVQSLVKSIELPDELRPEIVKQ